MTFTREFFAAKGKQGGSVKSAAKLAAARKNLSKTPTHIKRAKHNQTK